MRPHFDKSVAEVYTEETYSLFFNHPDHPYLHNVTISSTLNIKLTKYPARHTTPTSIGYNLKS